MRTTIARRYAALIACAGLGLATPALAQDKTVKIGVLNDMSSLYADIGGPNSVVAARMAVEDSGLVAKGWKIDVLSGDHQNKPDVGVNIARQWIDLDKVDAVVDTPTSSVALAVSNLVKDKNSILINDAIIMRLKSKSPQDLSTQAGLKLLKRLDHPDYHHHTAYRALTARPDRLTRWRWRISLGLAAQVRDLIEMLQHEHPELFSTLDAEALAWWRAYLSRPQYGPICCWSLIGLPPVIALFLAGAGHVDDAWLIDYGLSTLVLLALQCLWIFAVARPRQVWREGRWRARPLWLRLGWAPAALGLLLVNGLAPSSAVITGLIALLSVSVAAWGFITGETDTRPTLGWSWRPRGYFPAILIVFVGLHMLARPGVGISWRLRALTNFGYLILFWPHLMQPMSEDLWWRSCPPLAAALFVFTMGDLSLAQAWRQTLSRTMRLSLLAGLGGLSLGLASALWITAAAPVATPLTGALIAVLVIAHKPPATQLTGTPWLVRDLVMRYGWIVWSILSFSPALRPAVPALLFGGSWLLSGVLATAIGAALLERPPRAKASGWRKGWLA